jgi:hypothetical protein
MFALQNTKETSSKSNNTQHYVCSVVSKIDHALQNKSITGAREILEEEFNNSYEKFKYLKVPPIPLLSDVDKSVIFTGSTISAIKDILMNQGYLAGTNGVFLTQDCIRTGAKNYMFDNNWIPNGQIYFRMSSNLSRPERFNDVLNEALLFIENNVGVQLNSNKIKLLSSNKIDVLSNLKVQNKISIEYDTRDLDFYKWTYGIEGVYGSGLTISVYNELTSSWMNVGNVIAIYDNAGKELGTEFGFGYEYFLTALLNKDHPLRLSKIFDVFEFTPGLPLKYYYNLEAAANMKLANAGIGRKGSSHVYKEYLKSLQFIGSSLGKSEYDIIGDMSEYLKHFGHDIDLQPDFNFIANYSKNKQKFKNLVKRIGLNQWAVSKGIQPKEKFSNPISTIDNYLLRNGIKKEEVVVYLEPLKRFGILEKLQQPYIQ